MNVSILSYIIGSECEPGWETFKGNCYRMTTYFQDWTSSQYECVEKGANLASVLSEEENEFLRNFSVNHSQPNNPRLLPFIGAHRGVEAENPGKFFWIDESYFEYENFLYTENNGYYCTSLDSFDGIWNIASCFDYRYSICKKPIKGKYFVNKFF